MTYMNLSISGTGINVLGTRTRCGTEMAPNESSVDSMSPVGHYATVLGVGLYPRLRIARVPGRHVNEWPSRS
jgi:hypothetical protein